MSIRIAFCLALVACSSPSSAAPPVDATDVPRSVAGIFRVTSAIELSGVPEPAHELFEELAAATDEPDDPGRYLVDRMIDAMQDTTAKTIARELEPVLAGIVQAELSDIAPKLAPGLVAIAHDLERDARQWQTHELWRIQLGGAVDRVVTGVRFDDIDLAFADTQLPDATAASSVTLGSAGALDISDHQLAWSYGAVLRLALDRAVIPEIVPGAHDLAQALAQLVDCRRLGARMAAAIGVGPDALYTAACTIALTEAADRFYVRLPTGTVPLQLSGHARGVDRDADGNMDEIVGGTWSGSLDGDGLATATFDDKNDQMTSHVVICYPEGMVKTMSATQFKAKCLGVLDEIRAAGGEIIITKRGKPVAKLTPIVPSTKGARGSLKGKVWETGDIVNTDWSHLFDVLKK